jgi:hypothetical protein
MYAYRIAPQFPQSRTMCGRAKQCYYTVDFKIFYSCQKRFPNCYAFHVVQPFSQSKAGFSSLYPRMLARSVAFAHDRELV